MCKRFAEVEDQDQIKIRLRALARPPPTRAGSDILSCDRRIERRFLFFFCCTLGSSLLTQEKTHEVDTLAEGEQTKNFRSLAHYSHVPTEEEPRVSPLAPDALTRDSSSKKKNGGKRNFFLWTASACASWPLARVRALLGILGLSRKNIIISVSVWMDM